MTNSTSPPGPRDGLDEGSLADLAQDGCEIEIGVETEEPRPSVASTSGPIDVPDDATTMIEGLAAYGA